MHTTPLVAWDFIHVGACAWTDTRECVPCDVPRGIELRVEQATKSEPVLVANKPWEDGSLGWSQVIEDEGRYRMWYSMTRYSKPLAQYLLYAESEDGLEWHKPELGLIEIHGSKANNAVRSGTGANHSHVFKCPDEPPENRYRCMYFKSWWEGEPGEEIDNDEGHRRLDLKNAAKPGEETLPFSLNGKMLGLNSPDGIHFTEIEKPVLDEWHDTHNICYYDEEKKIYRAYLRGFYGGRRAVSYCESDDFENLPASKAIHHHSSDDLPDESLYSNCYTIYPGRPDIHLMFPAIYHQSSDTVYGQLAVSTNGLNWSRFSRQTIIPCGAAGEDDEGYVYPEPDLLRFNNEGKFRLLCHAGACYHNEWYNENLRNNHYSTFYSWAEWPEDRLAGAYAAGDGEFTIQMQTCGDRLLANFRTEQDGWIRFELVDRLVWPPQPFPGFEGFRFEDCDVLTSDETHRPVTWSGKADLSSMKGTNVAIRVRLHRATLFSTTMYGTDEPLVQDDPRYPV
ncbi:MAG: hypothetical protein QF437_07880 [Planctomycetota bacterium]|nr:hypothetical protein [Planctomycetota bacterium]MDP7130392.1 hypothetical protein [Planctomycetota bacterium]MDP7252801.1 hypothetical protein [Planctomycetota bacterium]